ncbi:alpha amylase C-terminal domain-containing protein [Muricauda sp. CAU 1633]|uniref:alpha-amylase family glycosyl hydrolase n=1 Tax=Allomuricauda sp. CAU 1633 TaxID=2816036 RepID=UPI001A8F525A|nr:alpha-amylase family glycosyl hydrolase [Muricauda sp. CAU 1633]MBO0321377.1 alpha amylase C-terminal domain-containing protein [Muricauda sp. CAU 1633]
MKTIRLITFLIVLGAVYSCKENRNEKPTELLMKKKTVVYQVFTRLFGNTNTTNKPWGTIDENGVGKFADFTDKALGEIKDLGVTHIWYTGVPHHALINDYTAHGISNDDPDVVKGRAGSPYAVKDYYNVNPDLALDPSNRLEEFKALIERTHKADMKVIIDIVPNHVARNYEGTTNPEGVEDFGASDDTSKEYDVNNNFYYIPGEAFKVPEWHNGYEPLGGEKNALADSKFEENPAKWTGNGSRLAQPHFNDWYETVKVNYGIRPDGTKDFEELPEELWTKDYKAHYEFWRDKTLPDSWYKFKDIAQYWLDFGVDGFRFDMAEMVPVEFWSYLNSSIKMKNPDAFLLAEVYNPDLYRAYIHMGKMDYLYDKVDLYDSIKHIMKGYGWTDHIPVVQQKVADIEHHMLHFLENHDEQRIASPDFVGDAKLAKPAMVVSATISTSPTMIYFGQEVGEPGAEDAGFGKPTRTSIFDYIGVPHHQRWVNNKNFDGGQLSKEEQDLRDFYQRLLNFTIESSALMGEYQEIHYYNKDHTESYDHRVFSYVRWSSNEKLIIVSNFDANKSYNFTLKVPEDIIAKWQLKNNVFQLEEKLYGQVDKVLSVNSGRGEIQLELQPLQSYIFSLKP